MNTGLEIAVVGLSGRFPGAKDVEEFWRRLLGGAGSAVEAEPVLEDPDKLDAEFFGLTPREAEATDPQHRLFLECAWEALEAAGHDPQTFGGTVGVYAGVAPGTYPAPSPDDDPDDLASLVSGRLHLTGPSLTVQASGAAALVAVHLASQGLLGGECDLALAGGSSFRAASAGGGVGVVVLKRLDDAIAGGDTILAVIKSSAINHGGAGRRGGEAARRAGQARVVRTAEFLAEVDPATPGYVETSGIAGLIKAVLALDREVIPAGLRAWKRGEEPRRAAVSSFSPGGANAHVILEEAPGPEPATASAPPEPAPEARDTGSLQTSRIAALASGSSRPELAPFPRAGDLPLSFAQQRLWLLDQLAPGNPFYNLASALRLSGRLDAAALRAALAGVVRRHEVLRTGFVGVAGLPVQRIEAVPEWAAPLIDLGALPAGARESEVSRLAREQARRPFDLARPPLLRAALLRLGRAEHVLLFTFHHIVSDGWSMGVLAHDVSRLYAAFAAGQPSPLAELPVQYADFAVWQRSWLQGEILESQLAYWRERLAGAPPVELPADHPRPPVQSFRGATLRTHLPAELAAAVSALARGQNVSLFMVLLAGFDALISRYTGLEDVVVGTPITGRTRAALEGLIGFFVNTLVLRADLSGDPKVPEMLSRVREMAVGAYGHQDLPFEYLVEKLQPQRDLARNPLFQIMFNLLNAPPGEVATGELTVSWLEAATGTALFDLQVYLTETPGGIAASWEYATDLFDAATVERMAGHFKTLLAGMAARPEARLGELALLSPGEREQLVAVWRSTARPVPSGCIHDWIAAQAALTPEAVAVVMGAESLTYRQLDRRANALAWRLRSLGVGPEARVGVALERAPEMVVALLAVLKAGGAYVPLDPAYPAERLAYMREDAGAAVVLTAGLLREGAGEEAGLPPAGGADPRNIAYVIYTSGSTGRPKGVQIPHLALANFLASMAERPGLGASDVMLAVTSLSFDIAGLELWLPLMVGARVVLASREEAADGRRLQALIAASGATVLQATPATWRLLLESGWKGGEGLKAFCGGEALPPALAAALRPRVAALWNVYGPTETTVWSTLDAVVDGGPISIGRPIANTAAHVLDGRGNLMPPGAPGELCLGGLGLARGYLGRPELTAERFVPDLFGPPGARLYRTGDLARHRADGRLEHLGRIDHQVKIRGYRIELGEIEAALGSHPEVEAAVVVVREEAGDRRLVAYVVARRPDLDLAGELRGWVLRSLPEYMAPAAWVRLDRLPLTPNGKVDRKALPAPVAAAVADVHVAPRNPVEEVLAGIWAEVLRVGRVGIDDDFFALGGHSLLATQVVSRVRQALGEAPPVRWIFERPTVRGLAARLGQGAGGFAAPPLVPVPRDGDLPLSFAQERLWFLHQLESESAAYNVPAAVRLEGRIDAAALAATLREIVRRHESLRTSFEVRSGRPVQVIAPAAELALPALDLGGLPAAAREEELRSLAAVERRRRFDLRRAPLLRAVLIRLTEDDHALFLTLHHIASDAWSAGVLVREMAALYGAFSQGRPSPLPELPVQYADFAVWQREWLRGEVLEAQVAWWRDLLAGAPVLALATDRPRAALQTYQGADRRFVLPGGAWEGVRALAGALGSTPFMVLLAGFESLLHRHTGQDDLTVGTTIANRTRGELEGLIGFFVNTLALRADLAGDPSFSVLAARVREVALGAYTHQDVPFEKLVAELQPDRDLSRSPLFQVLLQLHNAPLEAVELPGGLALRPVEGGGQTSKFDLVLNLAEAGEALAGVLRYNTGLFEPSTAERLLRGFGALLAGAVADPSLPLSRLPLLSDAERQQLALEWNATPAEDLGGEVLHRRFALQAARAPEAVAAVCDGERLTYGALDRRANQIANHLVGMGVVPGDLVGLRLERSLEMVAAILGVLKAGAAYVPLDPAYPAERLAFMVEDSGAAVTLTAEALAEIGGDVSDPQVPVSAGHPAYVIYTSGSTGRPKGVVVRHGNVARLFSATDPWLGFGPEDVWTLFHSYAFDFSVWEIWGALLHGGRLVVVPYWVSRSPEAFLELLARERVTVLNQTPSAFRQLLWAEEGRPRDLALRWVIFGGEALEPASLAPWIERHGDERPQLINMYGITETTVHVTFRRIRAADTASAVGRPIPDLGVYLAGPALDLVPVGVPGEILVGGAGLALGYLGRPELTAERFIPNPFGEPGSRLYRSGDLARRLPDGDLEYLGRIDHQVKIRGFRIELGEIEAALVGHPAVREAVALVREDRLVAWIVPDGEAPALADLRAFAAASLPDYMLPTALVVLDRLPLTANGKVDRRALPAAPEARADAAAYVAPRTPLESHLAGLFQEVLGIGRAGVRDNFFELGGSSITGAVLINRLQQELGQIVQVVVIFDHPTVASLASYLEAEHLAAAAPEAGRIGEAELARFDALIEPLAPVHPPRRNGRAVFVLSPPRSGSTLLRVMLGGHPGLFAPPELELLSFNTLRERAAAFHGRDSFWLEGAVRAVMEVRGCGPEEARAAIQACEAEDLTTAAFYGRLQEWLGGRVLVDKTPSYALDPAVLRRAEEVFEEPFYIHLIRHPYGMICSFEEAKLDQLFFRRGHSFGRRELAELVWLASHRNVVDFLASIPSGRQCWVWFEELVAEPERVLRGLCAALGIDYHPDMAEPYKERSARMTDGLHAESRMLGDVKFHRHSGVDRGTAERWRERYREGFLGDLTWEMAGWLGYRREGAPEVWRPIEAAAPEPGRPWPLSFAQERLWVLDRMDPGNPAYNIAVGLRLLGPLSVPALAASLAEIVRRHAVLRSALSLVEGEPRQVVAAAAPVPLPVADLSALPAPAREAEARRLARRVGRRPFDLERGPLLRAALLRLGEEEHAALFTVHHVASDGWSMGVLTSELSALYAAFLAGRPSPLPEPPIQYLDYARWQRAWLTGEVLERELAYWREALAGIEPLRLPTDRPRPAFQTFRGGSRSFALPAGLSASLRSLGQRQGGTLFMVLLAAFSALLGRLSGQDDIPVGSPSANRTRPQLGGLIGFFVNTLVLRADLSGSPSFEGLLGRARSAALAAFAHQELPFEKVVFELRPERDLSSPPLFQVMLALQNTPAEALTLPGLALRPFGMETGTAKFDLTLNVVETPAGLAGSLEHNADLFDPATIDRWLGSFRRLLEGAAADPAARIGEIPLLSAGERHQLVVEASDTAAGYPRGERLHEWISRRAAARPDAVAVTRGAERLTYGELEARSNRLARRLARHGAGRESLVGLCMERSLAMPVALLAILKAGGAYVPMDPAYPEERLAHMLEDAGLALLLAGPGAPEGLLRRAAGRVEVARLEDLEAAAGAEFAAAPRVPGDAADLAYVLYTSGSTGRPKGVEIPHGALVNFLAAMAERPGLAGGDVLLAVTSLSFDIAALELYLPLLAGARVDLVERETAADGARLLARLRSVGATVLQATPATWRMLVDAGWTGDPPLRALCGGEALPERLAGELRARSREVWNLYGPTETTVWSAVARVEEGGIVFGRPIANTRIDLLDPGMAPVPTGVPGELCIGGLGLARGYRRRPDLTAERFVPSPFAAADGQPGARLYRTGDLARRRPDGALELLGRIDHQVKVRGFRVELGEVESALERHPEVARAVALARGDRLAAFLVARGEVHPAASELRAGAAQVLPDYMVPAAFTWLEELPLTPNGKVDRRALARLEAPAEGAGGPAAEPRTPVEELLAAMWREILGRERIGVHEDFFDLGGHSLKATQLAARVRQAFGVELPLRRLFEAPTVAGLARAVERLRGEGGLPEAPPLAPVPRDGAPLALSFSQQRLWLLDQLEAAGTAYHLSLAVSLRGGLDPEALGWALSAVARRHEALRTVFASEHGRPSQVILPRLDVPMPRIDLGALPTPAREREARRLMGLAARLRFDLSRGPLLRAILLALGAREHLFALTVHHIVADAWSLGVLVREVAVLYQGRLEGAAPLPPLPVQYADFAAWQRSWLRGEALEAQLAYWRGRLAGLPPVLQLPLDHPRRPGRSAPLGTRRAQIGGELAEALRRLGRRGQATPFMTLLAGFAACLGRYTGQRDLAVGTPIANRGRVELEGMIGFFANTLVLRADLAGDPGFLDLLARVRAASLDAYAHQDLPFERLVEELQPERDLAVTPLFQVMFQMQNVPVPTLDLPGLTLAPVPNERGSAMFDLVLAAREAGGEFLAALEYDAGLFEPVTAERLARHWLNLLAGAAANPDRPLPELPMLAAAELHQATAEWSDSAALSRSSGRVHERIRRQVERTPDAVAVSFQGRRLTYRELDELAGRLAARLLALGVEPEEPVGVCLERSPEMVAALLAVWKAGAAYVPLDPSYPVDRLTYMLDDAGISLLLADAATPEALASRAARVARVDEEMTGELAAARPGDPDQLAYVIYTSGSTGRPKGVEISHAALANFLESLAERPGMGPEDVLLAVTSLSFDIAGLELFLPLLVGARVELAGRETAADGGRLLRLLRESGATVMQATPVTWRLLVDAGWRGGDGLEVLCGGEALPETLAAELCRRSESVWNVYGPTETTVWSALRRVRPDERIVVGSPVANTGLYLLDADLRPVPAGVPGELWIGGLGLARDYRDRPALTAERFVPDPFAAAAGARMYRTGDLARFRWDGAVEVLGRADHQVKVRGFRVEPGEIEAALEAHPGVARAVVMARGEEGARSLVAYLVARGGAPLSVTDLRESLGRGLPDYMIPSGWVLLDELPLTPNGKVDRRALPAPESAGAPALGAAYVPPRTALEEVVAGVWAEVLRVKRVGVQDNFFALGGHSLLATQVVSRVGEALEIEVPLRRLFEAPTVAGLAAAMLRDAADPEELERAAALVLDLLSLSEDEVDLLLLQHAGAGDDPMEAL